MRIVIVLLFAVITACRAQLTVDTPSSVVTCQNTLLTWSGGAADDSYIVQIAASPSGNTIQGFTGITSPSYSWLVTLPANTQAFIRILTITRKTAQSGVFTVQAGDNQACTGTSVAPPVVSSTPPSNPTTPTPDPNPPSTAPTPAGSSDTSSSTSTSTSSSASLTSASGSLSSQSNSTSLLSRTSTSSDATGVSGSSLGDTGSPSPSPNIGLIAGAAGGGSAALVLLVLGICLYSRRKRSAKVAEQSHPIETNAGGPASPVSKPYYPTYARYSSTAPIVTSYPSTNSPESSAVMNQSLHSEPRMTGAYTIPVTAPGHDAAIPFTPSGYNAAIPFTASGHNADVPFTASGYNAAIPFTASGYNAGVPFTAPGHNADVPIATVGYKTAIPVATTGYDTAIPATTPGHNNVTPGPIDDSPPKYRDEDEAQMKSQRIRAEEAERARRYDALIADFCASNRDLISPVLERKLHAARYFPEDNPSDVPAEYWHTTYGVEFFELRRLQTAYERNVATQALINMPEKALPKAALRAKGKTLYSSQQAEWP